MASDTAAHDEMPKTYDPTSPRLWRRLEPLARDKRRDATPAEDRLWQALRRSQLGFKFRRQHTVGRFIVDFYCSRAGLVVEVDGDIHDYSGAEDAARQEFLEHHGVRVLRFKNEQVLTSVGDVLAQIQEALTARDGASPR